MKFSFFNTGFPKVTFAFIVIVLIVLANVAVNYVIIEKNKKTVTNLTDVISPYIETLEEFNLVVTESKMYATNWVYLQNSVDDKKSFYGLMNTHYPDLKKRLNAFLLRLNNQEDKDELTAVFKEFDELINVEKEVMKTLVFFDDYENPEKKFKCEEIIESEVLPRTQIIMAKLNKIMSRNRKEAKILKAETESSLKRMMTIMLIASVGLFVFILFSVSFISGAIRKPVLKMKEVIQRLGKGELPDEKIVANDKNVVSEMATSVNALSESFSKTSMFANEIGKGNLTVPYEKLSENDVLGNALINMRDSLFAYSEDMELKVFERTQEVFEKSSKLELAYREIRDSITYAKRIQESILPSEEIISKVFTNSFIFYRPKDIVCGDFYWFAQKGDEVILAAIDCTGHGVPGALMTVIGNSLLNQIVSTSNSTDPAVILNQLDKKLMETFQQHGHASNTNDGMDAAIFRYRINKKEITFAGAKRPLYIFKNGELIEVKGNKSPIGSFGHDLDKLFTSHKLTVNKNDTVYLFSDGVQDQFGGEGGKKFMIKRFRELLEEIQPLSMPEQAMKVNQEMDKWQGKFEQTDDMLLIGVRF
jgi:serine phosphatase RsbU (regulator of sigma subunit)